MNLWTSWRQLALRRVIVTSLQLVRSPRENGNCGYGTQCDVSAVFYLQCKSNVIMCSISALYHKIIYLD